MLTRLAVLPALLAALWGCGDSFDPAYKLAKARVLAIKAEPPQPAFGQSTTLTPLFYLPNSASPNGDTTEIGRIAWSWCPVPGDSSLGFACAVDQAQWEAMASTMGLLQTPPLDLGEGPTGTFPNLFPVEVLAALCSNQASGEGGQFPVFDCKDGFPVMIRMVADTSAGTIEVVKRIYLSVETTALLNANPIVGGIRLTAPEPWTGPLDETGSVIVPRNRRMFLELALEETSAEEYSGRVQDPDTGLYQRAPDGNFLLAPTKERLNIAWFAEVGTFDDELGDQTAYDPDARDVAGIPIPFQKAREMIWKAPERFADKRPESLRIHNRFIVVIRDNRGGVDWTSAHIGLEDK